MRALISILIALGASIALVLWPACGQAWEADETIEREVHLKPGETAVFTDTSSFAWDGQHACLVFATVHDVAQRSLKFLHADSAGVTGVSLWTLTYEVAVPEFVPPERYEPYILAKWNTPSLIYFLPSRWDTIIQIHLVVESPDAVEAVSWAHVKQGFK